jgi:hypothetical protein
MRSRSPLEAQVQRIHRLDPCDFAPRTDIPLNSCTRAKYASISFLCSATDKRDRNLSISRA